MRPYRFLIDESVKSVATCFPRHRVLSLEKVGLPADAPDQSIVEVAYETDATIVTANGRDFVKLMDDFLKKQMEKTCRDLRGLIVIPNVAAIQQRVLRRAESRLRFGGEKIGWFDVWEFDLCVSIATDGSTRVTRFRPCYYCSKNVAT
jgi:hypothetical protein